MVIKQEEDGELDGIIIEIKDVVDVDRCRFPEEKQA